MCIVDKITHQQVFELIRALFEIVEFLDIKQIAAAALSIKNRHNLTPDFVLTGKARRQTRVADINVQLLGFSVAFIEGVAVPEWIRLMRNRSSDMSGGPH